MAGQISSGDVFHLLGMGEDREDANVRNLAISVVAREERGVSSQHVGARQEARLQAAAEWRGIFREALEQAFSDNLHEHDPVRLSSFEQTRVIKAGVLLAALDLGVLVETPIVSQPSVSE